MIRVLLSIIALLCVSMNVHSATIEGRVVTNEVPLPGVVVSAYETLDFQTEALVSSAPSDEEGYYRLEVPAGSYALYGWNSDRSRFAFSGRNPVNVETADVWIGMQSIAVDKAESAAYDDEYSAAVEGQVLINDEPVAGAYVYLYLDAEDDLKGQGYRLSQPTAADGFFRFDGLPESDYYLVARKRQGGERVGPVRTGDLFGLYPGNPLNAKAGKVQQVVLRCVEKLQDAIESENFGRAAGPVLSGVVVDDQGQGLAGLHVFAYTDRVIGHQRPAAISTPTGDDGAFIVNLPAPGTYYVGAREAYGDSPAPGELFGMYDESADHGLTVEQSQRLENLRIMVEPIAIFE